MIRFALLFLALTACGRGDARSVPDSSAIAPRRDSVPRTGATAPPSRPAVATPSLESEKIVLAEAPVVRGLYVNRFAAQSANKMRRLIALADSTEINAFVIDIKDEFGLNYTSGDSMVKRNAGRAGTIPNLPALLDTLKAHQIVAIARIVTFKDSVAARMNPAHIIRQPNGEAWRDHKGISWVNPFDAQIREYDIRVAEEVARLGFAEIQFDYIRFPEPFQSLPKQIFPGSTTESKPQALQDFLLQACGRLHRLDVRCAADIFGLVTTVPGALEIGQQWEHLAPVTDVLLPMVYPSHYPHGSFGLPHPNAEPYLVVDSAISKAHKRDMKLGLAQPEHVRPWLQAFTLGAPRYGPRELEEQKRGVYAAGYDGWVLWHPGSNYDAVQAGLEKTLVSRKKPWAPATVPRAAPSTRGNARDSIPR